MGTLNGHRVKDLLHFIKLHRRHQKRNRLWARSFKEVMEGESSNMPFPALIQILPTERCNLSCKMCDQWGERGYYHSHKDAVSDAPIEKLISFLKSIESSDFLLNIHGGEPFFYDHMDELLDYLIETGRDTLFTTNATLLDRHLPKLGRLKNAIYFISIEGDKDTNDRIRGCVTFQKIKDNLTKLKESCLAHSGLLPYLSMNLCVSEFIVPSDIYQAYNVAKELGFFNIEYGLRWFVTDKAGHEYERQLKKEFQINASDCWKAWKCDFGSFDAHGVAKAISRVRSNWIFRLRLPHISITPRYAKNAQQIESHFLEHHYSYGREKCLFPFYFARVHSDGSVIFCQGYRDVVIGNVFCDDFTRVFNSQIAKKFREFCRRDRFSICSKCCGLYITYVVDKFMRHGLIN